MKHNGFDDTDRSVAFTARDTQPVSPEYVGNSSWQTNSFIQQSPRPFDRTQFEPSWSAGGSTFPQPYGMTPSSVTFVPPEHMYDYIAQQEWPPNYAQMRSMSLGGPIGVQQFVHEMPVGHHPGLRRSNTYSSENQFPSHSYSFPTPPGSQTHSIGGTMSFEDVGGSSQAMQFSHPPHWGGLLGQPVHLSSAGAVPHAQAWYSPSPGLPEVGEEEYHYARHPP